jgi:purine-binding chemotaxis protein CheW
MTEQQADLDTETVDYVTFDMEGERYAFPMRRVQEIIRMPEAVRVPLGPSSLEGLANLRGRVLPIVSLRSCCLMPDAAHDENTRVIVVDGGVPLGFVVDRVSSVVSVDADAVEPADSVRATVGSDVLVGVIKSKDGEMTTVLDVDQLVRAQFARLADTRAATDVTEPGKPAESTVAAEEITDTLELVSFAVDGQEYALPIDRVQEIVQAPESVNRIPNSGDRVLGVIDLRGRLLPVVSMRQVFGLPVTPLQPQNRIVVVSVDDGVVGIVMDTVRQVLRVPLYLVAALPKVVTAGGRSTEVEAVCRLVGGKRLVSVLGVDRMFDSPDLRDALAAQVRAEPTDSSEEAGGMANVDDGRGDEELFVVFRLDREEYAVDVDAVQEIIRVPDALIRVPKTFDFVEGLVNLRGTVLPVVDLRTRLALSRAEPDDRQRIVVLILGGVRTGFVVDSVAEVARVARVVLEPAPELSEEQARIVSRVANLPDDQRMLLIVQVDQLLAPEQTEALAGVRAELAPAAV